MLRCDGPVWIVRPKCGDYDVKCPSIIVYLSCLHQVAHIKELLGGEYDWRFDLYPPEFGHKRWRNLLFLGDKDIRTAASSVYSSVEEAAAGCGDDGISGMVDHIFQRVETCRVKGLLDLTLIFEEMLNRRIGQSLNEAFPSILINSRREEGA